MSNNYIDTKDYVDVKDYIGDIYDLGTRADIIYTKTNIVSGMSEQEQLRIKNENNNIEKNMFGSNIQQTINEQPKKEQIKNTQKNIKVQPKQKNQSTNSINKQNKILKDYEYDKYDHDEYEQYDKYYD